MKLAFLRESWFFFSKLRMASTYRKLTLSSGHSLSSCMHSGISRNFSRFVRVIKNNLIQSSDSRKRCLLSSCFRIEMNS